MCVMIKWYKWTYLIIGEGVGMAGILELWLVAWNCCDFMVIILVSLLFTDMPSLHPTSTSP